jgi:hypothetical protein
VIVLRRKRLTVMYHEWKRTLRDSGVEGGIILKCIMEIQSTGGHIPSVSIKTQNFFRRR